MDCLTIIIPSNNRPALLRRSILYWSRQKFSVIVCDGSEASQSKWVHGLSTRNIKYFHSLSPLPQRLKMAADMVSTRYCILLSDDEFYSPTALDKCIDFLDKNEGYVAAGGVAVGFRPGNNGIVGFMQYPNWIGRERIESHPRDRIMAHMSSYANYLSASVTKSYAWKYIAHLYASYELPIYALWELEMNLILSYCGKSKVLNNLMLFRSSGECSPIRNNIPSLSTKVTLPLVWQSKKHLALKKRFLLITSVALEELPIEGTRSGFEKTDIEDAITAYCKPLKGSSVLNRFAGLAKKLFPGNAKNYIKLVFGPMRIVPAVGEVPLIDAVATLESMGVSVDHDDVKDIISSISDFYGNS